MDPKLARTRQASTTELNQNAAQEVMQHATAEHMMREEGITGRAALPSSLWSNSAAPKPSMSAVGCAHGQQKNNTTQLPVGCSSLAGVVFSESIH